MKLRNYLGLFMAMQTFKLQNSPILKNRSLNFVHLDMRATVENYATSQWGVGIMLVVLHGHGLFRISRITKYKTNEFELRGR